MAKPIKPVEEQWQEWQEKNPVSSFKPIDEVLLKETVTKNLDYVSSMDVKEYTLYQKWCEVKEKYPTKETFTLTDGHGSEMVNKDDEKRIQAIKNNIWIPKNPDDFMDLEPVLEYTDDSKLETIKNLVGTTQSLSKRSDLPEVWNTIRDFISTMKNNSNIGRNLNFIVKDKKTNKYLGVICISSDFLDLTPRDQAIGWSREVKTQQGMINYTAIGSTIVPLQPLGYNYMGGKLLDLLCLSDTVQILWKQKYGDVIV